MTRDGRQRASTSSREGTQRLQPRPTLTVFRQPARNQAESLMPRPAEDLPIACYVLPGNALECKSGGTFKWRPECTVHNSITDRMGIRKSRGRDLNAMLQEPEEAAMNENIIGTFSPANHVVPPGKNWKVLFLEPTGSGKTRIVEAGRGGKK